ncbi:WASH complex subunit 3 [Ochlerotatus camptorhynchus]|uniref:WASH complex subunit 3 n=1 Tax=Ochlerotatus camptorhynchus TaxID=644619 RepID=UPI0031D61FAA
METVGLEKHELPPTNQKRMVAFINHFVLSTVNFLNKFATDCETKFVRYEHKIQSLEASLSIVEAKLASIDALRNGSDIAGNQQPEVAIKPEGNSPEEDSKSEINQTVEESSKEEVIERDPQYERYFKMLQVGVPMPAVKNKIKVEGLDPDYIDAFL